ncbi:YdcF family protein [Alkalicoccobacillus porphyridii]|uniref:YdcF family protein n=1 Tax=Alkalicoccobacillus porphyridii TaxID=2597270 RepID=A0A553ZT82_9BACI|nr:YdcF family protein [Alkalicoccobacillus porphyridii]TSB44678.1 YdcF family protein [Alkalicoccobacillus porphyridii]
MFGKKVMLLLSVVFLIGVIYSIFLQTRIYHYSHQQINGEADYLIILGARVKGEEPSLSLQYRIEAAADYLLTHKNTLAIASGGQGPDEDISEALAIKRGLEKLGVEGSRIMLEDQSTSTYENISYSMAFISDPSQQGIVVSNGYHLCRAVLMAEEQGLQITGLAAETPAISIITAHLREYAALTKFYAQGLFR